MGDDEIVLGEEPWRVAVQEGDLEHLQNLIEIVGLEILTMNADSSGHGHDIPYTTPLLEAVVGNHLHIVQYLLEHCASVVDIQTTSVAHGGDYNGYSVLHFAVLNNNVDMARYLVQQGGCDVNVLDYDFGRKSPLHLAVQEGHAGMVQFLVESAGCNVDLMTNNGRTALDIAVADDKFDIVQILMQHSNSRTMDNNAENEQTMARRATKALHSVCNMERRPENMEMVQYFVETCRANVHESDDREYTVLHSACATGRLQLVQYLVETGHANVESCGETQRETPVFAACTNGHLDIVQYLVQQCRANVRDVCNAMRDSALHCAVREHELAVVQYLVETCRVNLYAQNANQETALHLASAYRDSEIALYMIPKCTVRTAAAAMDAKLATIDWVDNKGQTALHIASQCGHCRIVQCLLQEGRATFDARDGDGQTALHLAAANRHVGATLLLVQRLAVWEDVEETRGLERQQQQRAQSRVHELLPSTEESSAMKRPKHSH